MAAEIQEIKLKAPQLELPQRLGKLIHDFIVEYDDPAMALTLPTQN